jgi:hypothetical protein
MEEIIMKKNLFKNLFNKANKEDLEAMLTAVRADLATLGKTIADANANGNDMDDADILFESILEKFNKPVVLALLGASQKEDGTIKFNRKPVSAEQLANILAVAEEIYAYAKILMITSQSSDFSINTKKIKAAKGDTMKALNNISECVLNAGLIGELNKCGVEIHAGIVKKRAIIIGSVAIVVAGAGVGFAIYNHNKKKSELSLVDSIEITDDVDIDVDTADVADSEMAAGLTVDMI